jgi:probable HAF family extracellular repeat protein
VGPSGINDFGFIASGVIQDGVYVPAIYDSRRNQIATIGSFGGVTSFGFNGVATAINVFGRAVGYSHLDEFVHHAFIYRDRQLTDIGSFGGSSAAFDINDRGHVVGFAADSLGVGHAFVYRDGLMTEINPFGRPNNESAAEGINNLGRVVGWGITADGTSRGFVYSDDGPTVNVGTFKGGRNSYALAINDRNQVVGVADYPYLTVCSTPQGPVRCVQFAQHGFLYDDGKLIDVNDLVDRDLGWDLQWVSDINFWGQITGYGVLNGRFRAFVMTPKNRKHEHTDDDN